MYFVGFVVLGDVDDSAERGDHVDVDSELEEEYPSLVMLFWNDIGIILNIYAY